ncbi:MAG: 8-hydroxy-5-deazaflavin:NADPH oxidoreductase, partial [Thermoleophilaceae bacterium]|nr:8-hydroxy-5-deazaflavin:NADPH oxidoreductase [Thermoleophilaceae bacterium]
LWAKQRHEVMLSYSREPENLEQRAKVIGELATSGSVREAAEFGDAVLFSVPWSRIDEVLSEIGDEALDGKVVIDTTNQFGPDGLVELPEGKTAAQVNASRMPSGVHYVKAFNTLTAGFQGSAAGRSGDERVAMFLCGDDDEAKETVKKLIREIGFAPVDVGGTADAAVMEAPRRDGAVYGEAFSKAEAIGFLEGRKGG